MGGVFSKFKYGIYGGLAGAVLGAAGGFMLAGKENRVQSITGLATLGAAVGFGLGMFVFAPDEKPIGQTIEDTAIGIADGIGNGIGGIAEGIGTGIGNAAQGIGGGIGNIWSGIGGIFKK